MKFTRRFTLFVSMTVVASAICFLFAETPRAQQTPQNALKQNSILIRNVRIFDGINDSLRQGNVLIEGNKIKQISASAINAPADAQVIDGGNRVLMPGLTDAHWHMIFAPNTLANLDAADPGLMYANAVAGMNPYHLSRAFKQDIGYTPHRYVLMQRIERAKALLAKTDLPIVEVGLKVGFQSQSHFTKIFRRLTGVTPKTFRRFL